MSKPDRNSPATAIKSDLRTFFVMTSCWGDRNLLQSDRMARLLIDVLYHYHKAQKYRLHEFVVMPNHAHLLLSVGADLSIERAVQLVKGGFSHRASRELDYRHEIWQRGFSEQRILNAEQFIARRLYIRENPDRAGLASAPEQYPYGPAYHGFDVDDSPFAGAKALAAIAGIGGTTKVVP